MLIADNYLLMIPGVVDGSANRIVLYEVESLLELRDSTDNDLTGHPSVDLPDSAWGAIDFPKHKIDRWTAQIRLVKARLNTGGSIRITYAESAEWQQYLSDEDVHWIRMLLETAQIYKDAHEAQPDEPESEPPKKVTKPKQPKLKAKDRRRRDRRRGGTYAA